ncbi:MAG: c-type cytochrome [Nitrospiria bacterium]
MRRSGLIGISFITLLTAVGLVLGQTLKEPEVNKVPAEYQNKHIPAGWWTDTKIIQEGKRIYEGLDNAMVNCSICHGVDGKPMMPGARDLRDSAYMNKMTDSYWFWRISEGVPDTQMQGFKMILKQDQIWKVMVYEHIYSHGGKGAVHIVLEQNNSRQGLR